MRIHNFDENAKELVEAGDIVSFEFGDKLAIEGLVVESENGLEVQLDEKGEEYITELLPLAIAAGGLAWSAYDAYQAAKAYKAGEIDKNDLIASVGTDVALSITGGLLAKGATKGYKAFKKMWNGQKPTATDITTKIDDPIDSVTTKSAQALAPQADNAAGEIADRSKTNTTAKSDSPDAKNKPKKDKKNRTNMSPVSGNSDTAKSDFLSKFGPHAQKNNNLPEEIERLLKLSGVEEAIYKRPTMPKQFFRNIAMMDPEQGFNTINKLLTTKSPEGDVIRDVYDDTAAENGLHGDDDFEEIIDIMLQDFEDMEPGPGSNMSEAEYQGKKVTLNKPIRTGKDEPKKFKVYVKDGDKVKMVRFGHQGKGNEKTMKIKKSNPERRKSFRARHNCSNPGPKTKARYWSCRAW